MNFIAGIQINPGTAGSNKISFSVIQAQLKYLAEPVLYKKRQSKTITSVMPQGGNDKYPVENPDTAVNPEVFFQPGYLSPL